MTPKNIPVKLVFDKPLKTGKSIKIGYTPNFYIIFDASLVILN